MQMPIMGDQLVLLGTEPVRIIILHIILSYIVNSQQSLKNKSQARFLAFEHNAATSVKPWSMK